MRTRSTPKLGISSLDRKHSDKVHHGLVLVSDGRSAPKPARLELTHESLCVQVPTNLKGLEGTDESVLRAVTLQRGEDGGLGLSIKGGSDGSCKVPVLISKIFKNQAAEESGQLFVADTIIEINGLNVENCTHDEVVRMLRDGGDQVQFLIQHDRTMNPFLRSGVGGSLRRPSAQSYNQFNSLGRTATTISRTGTMKSEKSTVTQSSETSNQSKEIPKGWDILVKIPLAMAYVSRYLWGTDKLRPKGFELRGVDGTSTGIIQCEDPKIVEEWVKFITSNIVTLNSKTIKVSNKYLPSQELIVYLGWVSERSETAGVEFYQNWEPLFVILKGNEICFYESPPLNSTDLSECRYMYKIYDTSFKILKPQQLVDQRKFCAQVDSSDKTKHYFSVESKEALTQLESAWHRCTYFAVQREQTRTFACTYEARPCAMTLEFKGGISLYDIHSKVYLWKRKFSQLRGSADDGHMRLNMTFAVPSTKQTTLVQETKEIESMQLYQLLFCLHSFMIARLLSLDPDFLQSQGL